ncbi:BF3164 family lipoprotein [Phocaeicola sp.]
MKKYILFLIIPFCLCGCVNRSAISFDAGVLDKATSIISPSVLIKPDMDCRYPIRLMKVDSLFVVQDLGSDAYVNLFDKEGNYMDCLVKKGQGPNEIPNLSSPFMMDGARKKISVYSRPAIVEYDLYKFLQHETDYCEKITLPDNCDSIPVHGVRKLNGDLLLEGFTDKMRFSIVKKDGSVLSYNQYPLIGGGDVSEEETAAVLSYACKIAVRPGGEYWAQGTYIGGTLEIFKRNNDQITSEYQTFIFPSEYDGMGSQVSWNEKTHIGFDDMVATSDYIYTLLNGTLGANLKQMPPVTPFADRITIFDWQGNVVKVIKTDCMMIALDVDEKEQKCYVLAYNGDEGFELRSVDLK